MKKGILSILIAFIGFYILYRLHIKWYTIASEAYVAKEMKASLIQELLSFQKLGKIICVSISLLSLYLGTISFLKKNKIGLIGIILSIILIVSSFIPFWEYAIENT
ncbi:hypothetical protein [Aquimarina sp. 2201CG5-10]|uniref:hypothetical protein n=1 Tax=Aquimarina callyspongiae TaxID=3098150 RepID=UPI002AB5ADB0|nr:hypothetical protein [Aquimarina sp. 2201CG5-10]MDY8138890.1 hypothetical protein [Aquimarina sp. 2201CG5-10]